MGNQVSVHSFAARFPEASYLLEGDEETGDGKPASVDDCLCLCPGVIRILGSNVQRFSSDLCCGTVMKIKSVLVKPLTH